MRTQKLWLMMVLMVVCLPGRSPAAQPPSAAGTFSGRVFIERNVPLPGGVVSFFHVQAGPPPMLSGMMRVPDLVGRVDAQGRFSVRLVPGEYYMGALIVTDPSRGPGPPRPGEKFFFARNEEGRLRTFTVKSRGNHEAGTIQVASPEKFPEEKNFFTVKGRVLDVDGKPFPDAVVLVKTRVDAVRPDFVSKRVEEDGGFTLRLPAGTYYFMARQVVGETAVGRPVPGTFIGTYEGAASDKQAAEHEPSKIGPPEGVAPPGDVGPQTSVGSPSGVNPATGLDDGKPAPVSGKAGDVLTGLVITMGEIPVPGEYREQLQGTSEGRKLVPAPESAGDS